MLKWFRMPANPEMRPAALHKQLTQLELLLVEREDLGSDVAFGGVGKQVKRTLSLLYSLCDDQVVCVRIFFFSLFVQRVTAEWFGHIVSWLGPFEPDMLKRVASLCSKPWFHGHLSSAQVKKKKDHRKN